MLFRSTTLLVCRRIARNPHSRLGERSPVKTIAKTDPGFARTDELSAPKRNVRDIVVLVVVWMLTDSGQRKRRPTMDKSRRVPHMSSSVTVQSVHALLATTQRIEQAVRPCATRTILNTICGGVRDVCGKAWDPYRHRGKSKLVNGRPSATGCPHVAIPGLVQSSYSMCWAWYT